MPRRTMTTIAAAGLIALGALAGAGSASAASCPAGQHWNDMGGGAGFCSPDASGGGTGGDAEVDLGGSATPAPEAPPVPVVPAYTAPAVAPVPTAPVPAPVQPVVPQAPDEALVTGLVPAQGTDTAPPLDIPEGVAPVSGTVPPAAALEESVAQPSGATPAAPGVTEESAVLSAPSTAASASAAPTAVRVGQATASTAATIVFLLIAVAGTLGIVALLLVRHYRTPRRRTTRAPRHLP